MLRIVVALTAALLLLPGVAGAQGYPTRQISIVVTFPPGGNADVTARLLADKLSQAFKQTVIVENKPGAATIPGTSAVLQAPADGYTLLQAGTNTNINPILGNKTPYDAERDLVPVALLVTVPAVLVVHASVPANNVAELIALAKAKPGELNYGSAGNGTFAHLAMEQFNQATGTKTTHVPFKGLGPSMIGLLRNDVQIMTSDIPGSLEHIPCPIYLRRLRMCAHENCTFPDTRLPMLRFGTRHARGFERARHPACQVTRGFAQAGRERAIGHDGADAGHHDRDGRQQMRA